MDRLRKPILALTLIAFAGGCTAPGAGNPPGSLGSVQADRAATGAAIGIGVVLFLAIVAGRDLANGI